MTVAEELSALRMAVDELCVEVQWVNRNRQEKDMSADERESRPVESVLEIDEFNLEREWGRQPKLFFRWAKEAADARLAMDEAKAGLEIARAETDSEVRADPEKFGIDGKVTEKMVEAAVCQSAAYVRAVRRLGNAKHRHEIMSALVSALEQRKSALENLVRLHLANYYSEPRAPREHREELEEAQKDRAFRPRRRSEDV